MSFLSGLSMTMAGTSAPASGGEHLISHTIDMVSAVEGKVWEEALVYYDTVWPKLEAILAAPPLNTGGDDGENT